MRRLLAPVCTPTRRLVIVAMAAFLSFVRYAPYQPRFEWNLWFASLGSVDQNPWVVHTEMRLLEGSPPVLGLFRSNPFPKGPAAIRVVLWQYWFSTREEKARTDAWWDRKLVGEYAPTVHRNE